MRALPKILISLLVTGIVASSALLLSNAFFSDTETSANNNFTAGKLDLKINHTDNPSAVVTITDLKPGDDISVPKTLTIDNNPAWVWLHIKSLVPDQGTQTEPEISAETALGGPKDDIQNYMDYDLTVAGTPIINSSDHIRLPDAVSCWIPLGQIEGGKDIPMQQSFHFDKDVTNWAQGDVLTFTEEFYATQIRNNPNPVPPDTGTGRVWDSDKKMCVNKEAVLVDTVVVPANQYTDTLSHISLTSGKNYRLEAIGAWANSLNLADAEYTTEDNWATHHDGYDISPYFLGPGEFDLQVDDGFIDWGAYAATHTYNFTYAGTGNPVKFMIFDGDSTIPAINQGWYSDNSGNLTVNIYQLP